MAPNSHFTSEHLFNLKDRVALVTGGGSGIGLMVTQTLAANGARVYITGRTKEKLDNVVSKHGGDKIAGEIIAIPSDVSTKEGVQKLYSEISSREKCLCILVNNAGIASSPVTTEAEGDAQAMKENLFDTDKTTIADWTDTYQTNVASIFFVTSAFLPLLQHSTVRHPGWSGTVLNISSISGLVKTAQHHFSYNASKAAAIHLTRMLAAEVSLKDAGGLKIRINSIAPGVFPSEMTAKAPAKEDQKSELPKDKLAHIPAGRPGKDEDMASAVLMLVSNQYVNGQTLVVDGGYTLDAGM